MLSNRLQNKECLEAFCACTGVPVTLYYPDGSIWHEFLPEKKFCQFFGLYRRAGECASERLFSAQFSREMGEPYVFYCPLGLVHITVPLVIDGQYQGFVTAGPLEMGAFDDRLIERALSKNPDAAGSIVKIALFMGQMRQYTPTEIQNVSSLLYSAVLCNYKNWQDYESLNARHQRQLDMGVHIQKRKNAPATPAASALSCTELESQLGRLLQEGAEEQALTCLDELINELILVEGGNFDSCKLHFFELFFSLSRTALGNGVPLRTIIGEDFEWISGLNNVNTVEELSVWGTMVVSHFTGKVFAGRSQVSEIITQALAHISAHYMEKLTLRVLAAQLFVSEPYLSKLFRQELDTSFTDYLNRTRIEHSVDLMRHTELSLLEISGRVGFEDQSYFTKVFKRLIGKTPRQYKKQISEERGEGDRD
ncbi:MAG: helix-turn-helix domain-containing protein [Oscillibacter sp.]|nr:helix-turn-helix domain-containing protein [Oscillibacter sp.]